MDIENALIEERRTFQVLRDDLAIATTPELNRNRQCTLTTLPLLVVVGISVLGEFWVGLFLAAALASLLYPFVVCSKVVITPEHIRIEEHFLHLVFGKRSVPFPDTEPGILVKNVNRSGTSFSVDFPHSEGSLAITGFKTREACEDLLSFTQKLRQGESKVPAPNEGQDMSVIGNQSA